MYKRISHRLQPFCAIPRIWKTTWDTVFWAFADCWFTWGILSDFVRILGRNVPKTVPRAVKWEWWGQFPEMTGTWTLEKNRWVGCDIFPRISWHLEILACLNLSISGDTMYVYSKLESFQYSRHFQEFPGTLFFLEYIIAEHVFNESTSSVGCVWRYLLTTWRALEARHPSRPIPFIHAEIWSNERASI